MTDDSSLAKPRDIKSRVSDRIRETFLELISPEEFDALVQGEIKAFTEDRVQNDLYSGRSSTVKAPLKVLIEEEIKAIFVEKIKEELAKPEYQQGIWTATGATPSEFVRQVIEANLKEIVVAQHAFMFQSMVSQMQSQLNSMSPRPYI